MQALQPCHQLSGNIHNSYTSLRNDYIIVPCTGPLDVYLAEKPKLSETAKKILQVLLSHSAARSCDNHVMLFSSSFIVIVLTRTSW